MASGSGLAFNRAQCRPIGELDRGGRRALERRHRAARRFELVEQNQRARLVGVFRNGTVSDLTDETQCAFRAYQQMGEDIDRIFEIDQRVQAVACRVLHPELVPDARGEHRIVARLASERIQSLHQVLPSFRKRRAARGVARIEQRTVGKDDTQANQRVVAVLRGSATHAAGIVGGNTTNHRGVDRRRVGSDLAPKARQPLVGHRANDARLQRDRGGVRSDAAATPVVAEQQEHRDGDRLPREARASGTDVTGVLRRARGEQTQ
jgi:hypothetical protein